MEAIYWLIAIIVFLILEAITVSVTSIWFAVGALVALVASLLSAPIWLQIVLFLAVSGVMLAALRPLVNKYIKPRIVATNVDSVIGSEGYVTIAIDNGSAKGQVKLDAMVWTARSTSGDIIPEGTLVRVDKVEGVKIFVSPAKMPVKN